MEKYYMNAEDNAAFDCCIDVMTKIILKYGNQVLQNLAQNEMRNEDNKAA